MLLYLGDSEISAYKLLEAFDWSVL